MWPLKILAPKSYHRATSKQTMVKCAFNIIGTDLFKHRVNITLKNFRKYQMSKSEVHKSFSFRNTLAKSYQNRNFNLWKLRRSSPSGQVWEFPPPPQPEDFLVLVWSTSACTGNNSFEMLFRYHIQKSRAKCGLIFLVNDKNSAGICGILLCFSVI